MGKKYKGKAIPHNVEAQLIFAKFRAQRLRDAGVIVKTVTHATKMKSKWKKKAEGVY